MEILRRLLTSSIGRKLIMAITGFMLGGFLLVHVVGNSSIFFGGASFNSYAEHLHALGPVIPVFEVGLLAIFLGHILFGTLLFFSNRQARPDSYAVQRSAGGRSIGSRTMFYSGLVILTLVSFHLATVHFVEHTEPINVLIRHEFSKSLVVVFYCLALLALGVHISHGFWSLWQSVGFNHELYNGVLRGGAWFLTVVIVGIFLIIPLLGLFWSGFLL